MLRVSIGVPWDAVELQKSIYGKLVLGKEALDFISGHFETHEPLPEEKLNQLLKAKTIKQRCLCYVNLNLACLIFSPSSYF